MTARLHCGDALALLRTLPDGAARCCVTSPPYWGLRDYGVAGQLGLERTPEEYVGRLVEVMREVRRVLADDGTLWLNLGDSYAGGGRGGNPDESPFRKQATNVGSVTGATKNPWPVPKGRKPKDLVGIPWRVAFALQADGWWLRSDIVWSKPNPMPESVQGSHYSRHLVTIDEYERLSGLRYVNERAGDAWSGDMPPLSEREAFSHQAPLSAEYEGDGYGSGERGTCRRTGEAPTVQSIAVRETQQGEIREDREGHQDTPENISEVSRQPQGEARERAASPADTSPTDPSTAAAESQLCLPQDREGQSAIEAAICAASGGDPLNGTPTHGSGVAGNRESECRPLLLLQAKEEADTGSCDSAQQGRATREGERGAGVRSVQFQQGRQDAPALLVGCPGCSKCLKHHGYIFHLSAGRPTRSHEYIFLLSKSGRYYYDAEAIAEPSAYPGDNRARRTDTGKVVEPLCRDNGSRARTGNPTGQTRNARSVWTIASNPYPEAHFATFPKELAGRCILAGSAPGDTVLDPFAGSGTVGQVATGNGRSAILIELNPKYLPLIEDRVGPMLCERVR